MKDLKTILLAATALAAASLYAGALKWTGAANTFNWADAANWTATDGGVVDLSAQNDYDFSDLPANSTVDNTLALKIGSLTFGANQGTVTLAGTSANVEHYAGTWTVPSGTTLAYNMKHSQTYGNGGTITIAGDGAVLFSSTSFRASSRAWTLQDSITVSVYGASGNNASAGSAFAWGVFNVNGSSTLRFLADNTVGSITTTDGSTSGTVEIGAHTLSMQAVSKNDSTFGGKIVGAGNFLLDGGRAMTIGSAWPEFTGRLSLLGYSVAAAANGFDPSLRLECAKHGVMTLAGNQTFAAISGNGTSGGVSVPSGANLTVSGATPGRSVFSARLTGAGGLVKEGASSELVLAGANDCAGAVVARGGTLTAAGAMRDYPAGLVNRWSFEGDSGRFEDSGPGSNPLYAWNGNAVPEFRADGVGGSQCVHFDRATSTKMILRTMQNTHIRTNAHFTISMWFRPTQTAVENGGYLFYGAYTESNPEGFSACVIVPRNSDGYTLAVGGFGWTTMRAIATNEWHHLAIAQDTERRVYLDGVCVNRKTLEWNVKACQLSIGNYPGWNSAFDGDIDEVLTFDRALSADEIKTLIDVPIPYVTGERTASLLPAPVAYWSFDDPSAPGKDTSGNGYDLTPTGNTSKIENQVGGAAGVPTGGNALKIVNHSNRGWLTWTGEEWPEKIPSGGKAFSVSVRMASNWETGNGGPVFVMGDMSTANSFFSVVYGGDPKRCGAQFTSINSQSVDFGPDAAPGTGFTAPDSMTHVVFTWNPDTKYMTLYADGRTEKNYVYAASGLNVSPKDILVGYRNDGKRGNCFHGIIDDVQVFDRVLSADEVRRLTLSLAGVSPSASSLPTNSAATVEAGARLCVRNAGEKVRTLSGAGDLEVTAGASLEVAAPCSFAGAVSGGGTIDAHAPLALTGDGGAFAGSLVWTNGASLTLPASFTNCTIVLDESRPFAVASDKTVTPRYDLPGTYVVPATGRVVFDGTLSQFVGDHVLATAALIVSPASFDGWTVQPAIDNTRIMFVVDGQAFKVRVLTPTLTIVIR